MDVWGSLAIGQISLQISSRFVRAITERYRTNQTQSLAFVLDDDSWSILRGDPVSFAGEFAKRNKLRWDNNFGLITEGRLEFKSVGLNASNQFLPNIGVLVGEFEQADFHSLVESPDFVSIGSIEDFQLIEGPLLVPLESAPKTWAQELLGISKLRLLGLDGSGVRVGVLDTGVDRTHTAIEKCVKGYSKYNREGRILAGATATDSWGHGTHVCGVIAAESTRYADIGVAPCCELYVANVMGTGSRKKMLSALDWCVKKRTRIINISMGINGYVPVYEKVFDRLVRELNVLVVAAIGNEGEGTSSSPGNYPTVLSVGAMQDNGKVWPDSSSSRFARDLDAVQPDILAPGRSIYSTLPNESYGMKSGTSQAAPIVTGVIALLTHGFPSLDAYTVMEVIEATSHPKNTLEAARSEYGVIDPMAAYQRIVSM